MKTINVDLFNQIEMEISQTKHKNYYKYIPLTEYTLETKLTLDLLVEKYGGHIYRDDYRITLFINFSHQKSNNPTQLHINLLQKMKEIEGKIEQLREAIELANSEKNKNYFTYMDYFSSIQDIHYDSQKLKELVDEVIQHNKA